MIQVKIFPFNPFQCNAYVLWDESKEAIVIDPSFSNEPEFQVFDQFLKKQDLKLVGAYNTHCHFDHCFGATSLKKYYNMGYSAHKDGVMFTENAARQAAVYGLQIDKIEAPSNHIEENDTIKFGNSELQILFTPGHAAGSLCFVSEAGKFVITGDVLFRESIGRTDLPTGDLDLLLSSINNKLFKLPGDYVAYPGHGPQTTLAHEEANNPFLHFGEMH